MVSVQNGTLNGRRLNHILRHVRWSQVWAASLGLKLGLDINSFLEKDALQQRILVAQHQAFIGSASVSCLEIGEIRLMDSNRLFQLLDVLCAALPKGGLRLAVPLLPLLRGSINRLSTALALCWLSFRGSRRTLLMVGSRGLGVGRSVFLGRVFVIDRHIVRHDNSPGEN